jgi:hypothetical protein
MTSADNIKKKIEKINIKTNPEAKQVLLDTLHRRMDQSQNSHAVASGQNIWSLMMRNKITQFTTMAIGVVTIFIGNNIFFGSSASIADPIINVKSVVMDLIIGPEGKQTRIHDEVWGSIIYRTTPDIPGTENIENIIDLANKEILSLDHEKKKATITEIKGLEISNYLQLIQDVNSFIMEEPYIESINDIEYIVYVGKNKDQSVTIWADAETFLPFLMAQETKTC